MGEEKGECRRGIAVGIGELEAEKGSNEEGRRKRNNAGKELEECSWNWVS